VNHHSTATGSERTAGLEGARAARAVSRAVSLRDDRVETQQDPVREQDRSEDPRVREADGGELGRPIMTEQQLVHPAHRDHQQVRERDRPGEPREPRGLVPDGSRAALRRNVPLQ
jgi:hypothetical protein